MIQALLILNSGSSSIKFALYPKAPSADDRLAFYRGEIEGIGDAARLIARDTAGKPVADTVIAGPATHEAALSALLEWIGGHSDGVALAAAGHRVVHGGEDFVRPVRLTASVLEKLRRLSPLAPQHQPHNLAAIDALSRLHSGLPQVACFDTSFHTSEPRSPPLSRCRARSPKRACAATGFTAFPTNISPAFSPIISVPPPTARSSLPISATAPACARWRDRRSVATTMGFGALDGLVMGKRCGALDPGVILYLLDQEGMSSRAISHLLYEESGLLGVSGVSDDMRELLSSQDAHAVEAINLFVYRIVRELGSLAAALGGLDALVFTGGIGENASVIRAEVCRQAAWLGVKLDDAANSAGSARISSRDSPIAVLALPTNEEAVIARHTRALA